MSPLYIFQRRLATASGDKRLDCPKGDLEIEKKEEYEKKA
jgi:hypothetical protein